jgi:hypothetical protein
MKIKRRGQRDLQIKKMKKLRRRVQSIKKIHFSPFGVLES